MGVLESVYGELDVTVASSKPGFLKQIPEVAMAQYETARNGGCVWGFDIRPFRPS